MNEKALRVLEYPKIIQKLTDYAGSQPGKAAVPRISSPSSDLTHDPPDADVRQVTL